MKLNQIILIRQCRMISQASKVDHLNVTENDPRFIIARKCKLMRLTQVVVLVVVVVDTDLPVKYLEQYAHNKHLDHELRHNERTMQLLLAKREELGKISN